MQTPSSSEGVLLKRHAQITTGALDGVAAEAIRAMVIDDADCLHPRVDDDGTDELESAFL